MHVEKLEDESKIIYFEAVAAGYFKFSHQNLLSGADFRPRGDIVPDLALNY